MIKTAIIIAVIVNIFFMISSFYTAIVSHDPSWFIASFIYAVLLGILLVIGYIFEGGDM